MADRFDKELDMQTRKILAGLTALSLAMSSGLAFAAPDDHDRGRGPAPRGNAYGHDRDRHDDRRDDRRDNRRFERHDGPGAGPDHAFYRGGRLPPEYRNRQYVVDDWRGHRLSAPPRGYHWVQAGGDYVLAAIATGVIVSIMLNH
jgi:Ni/Co efflux regulator RcnB